MARGTRWLRALLVVPVLVFVLSASSSHLEIRCALTGLVMPACCPEAAPTLAQRPPQQASIGERDCCDRMVVATDKLPATGPASAFEKAPLPLGRLVPSLVVASKPAFAAREGRPDVGLGRSSPPPYLLTHAFLI